MSLPTQNTLAYAKVPLGTPLVGSASGGAQANNVTITASAGKTAYVQGFLVTGGGATAASLIAITLADGTNTLNYALAIPAGATGGVTPLSVSFDPPLPAATTGATWTLSVPSYGAGNTSAAVALVGFQV